MEGEFIILCMEGKLEEAKKFLEENPKIDISAENDMAFRMVCDEGHLEVAKWLLEVKPDINISADEEEAFLDSCKNGKLEVAEWLQRFYPTKYSITIKRKIESYKVIK